MRANMARLVNHDKPTGMATAWQTGPSPTALAAGTGSGFHPAA
tara:strand:- start:5572 stop:5700 length:129 start_codon:yes stop_codon:yes gene_type:complete